MSPVAVRGHRAIRIPVVVLVVLFFVFGGSFLPLTPFPANSGPTFATTALTGDAASRFIRYWHTKDPSATTAIGRSRSGTADAGLDSGQVVVLTGRRAQLPTGVLGWLASTFSAFADSYYYYTDGGVMVITPFEDADPNIAAFDIYYSDSEGSMGGQARVDTYGAVYGDPEDAIEITGEWASCSAAAPTDSYLARIWRSLAGSVSAQTSHKGGSCENMAHIDEVSKQNLKEGLLAALAAAGGAAIPCIGATIGWAVCVGGAALGAAAVVLGWDLATMLWDCRCTWFGVGCDDEPPYPI